jgi:signal transduction histidine kinase
MKKCLLSSPKQLNDAGRLQSYSNQLMEHHEEITYTLCKEINQIITRNQVANVLLQEISLLLGDTFQVDYCCLIAIANTQDNQLISASWCSQRYLDLLSSDEKFLVENCFKDLALQQQKNPLLTEPFTTEEILEICENLETPNLQSSLQYLNFQSKSFLAIPTKFNGYINGLISLMKLKPYHWHQSEKQLLKTVEPFCAVAFSQIIQAQILKSQQQHDEKINQYQKSLIRQLTLLNRNNLELHQMLKIVIASTSESLEVDRGLLVLLKYTEPPFRNRPQKKVPQAKATLVGAWSKQTDGKSDNSLDQHFSISDCSLCQSIFMESKQLLIIDQNTEKDQGWHPAAVFATEDFATTLLMPLSNQGVILGFIVFQQTANRSWQLSELNLIEILCAQLSNSIIQSETLRQVQTLVDERTEQLKRSLEIQARLHERTKLYVEQLQELNQLKDEFVSNISDRLRYPLTNMRMSIRNLRLPGISPERQARYLDILESECTKEINLINDLLTLQKLECYQEVPQLESIDLPERIQQLIAGFDKHLLDNGLTISLDLPEQPLKIQTELESFDRILQELLSNACKYSEYGTNIHFQAVHQIEQQANQVIIKVINIGAGISPDETNYIFDKFHRGKGRWTPGTGLGLALVKSLVQHLNGAISVESNPIPGSEFSEICFTLTLFPEENR